MKTISLARTAPGRSLVNVRRSAGRAIAPHDFLEARLVDRHLAGLELGELPFVLVDADDVVPVFGQARAQHETDIPCPDNSNSHFTIRY